MWFVGSPPFLLILSGQAQYFFIPFKGTSNPNQTKQEHIKQKFKIINRRKTKENDHV